MGPPNATLSVEIVDAKDPQGTVFLLHGIRADKGSLRGLAKSVAAAGFRAVLVDLRGHGRSTGDYLSYGVVESRDLAQTLDALEARGLRVGAVGVIGFSYGAATAIEWAGQDPRIRAVIALAPFASLRKVVPGYTVLPLSSSFVNEAIDLAGARGGFDPDQASPMVANAHTDAHVLLIHGLDDRRIPPWHSRLIFAAGSGHSAILLVPGEGHLSILEAPVVREQAALWFAEYLRDRPAAPPARVQPAAPR